MNVILSIFLEENSLENSENFQNNSAIAMEKSNTFENEGMELHLHSNLIVLNYIPENQ